MNHFVHDPRQIKLGCPGGDCLSGFLESRDIAHCEMEGGMQQVFSTFGGWIHFLGDVVCGPEVSCAIQGQYGLPTDGGTRGEGDIRGVQHGRVVKGPLDRRDLGAGDARGSAG